MFLPRCIELHILVSRSDHNKAKLQRRHLRFAHNSSRLVLIFIFDKHNKPDSTIRWQEVKICTLQHVLFQSYIFKRNGMLQKLGTRCRDTLPVRLPHDYISVSTRLSQLFVVLWLKYHVFISVELMGVCSTHYLYTKCPSCQLIKSQNKNLFHSRFFQCVVLLGCRTYLPFDDYDCCVNWSCVQS